MASKTRITPENISSAVGKLITIQNMGNSFWVYSPIDPVPGASLYIAGGSEYNHDPRQQWRLIHKDGGRCQFQNVDNSLYTWIPARSPPGTPVTLSAVPTDWYLEYDFAKDYYYIIDTSSLHWTVNGGINSLVTLGDKHMESGFNLYFI